MYLCIYRSVQNVTDCSRIFQDDKLNNDNRYEIGGWEWAVRRHTLWPSDLNSTSKNPTGIYYHSLSIPACIRQLAGCTRPRSDIQFFWVNLITVFAFVFPLPSFSFGALPPSVAVALLSFDSFVILGRRDVGINIREIVSYSRGFPK